MSFFLAFYQTMLSQVKAIQTDDTGGASVDVAVKCIRPNRNGRVQSNDGLEKEVMKEVNMIDELKDCGHVMKVSAAFRTKYKDLPPVVQKEIKPKPQPDAFIMGMVSILNLTQSTIYLVSAIGF